MPWSSWSGSWLKSSNLELDLWSGWGKFSDLKPKSSPVRQFATEPLPYWAIVQVILHYRTWYQVRFNQFLNFEPDFGQVCQGSGLNFGSGPNRGITTHCMRCSQSHSTVHVVWEAVAPVNSKELWTHTSVFLLQILGQNLYPKKLPPSPKKK